MSLTADSLYVSKTDDNQILDLIPLIEVTKFELAANDGNDKNPAPNHSSLSSSFRKLKTLEIAAGSGSDTLLCAFEPEDRDLVVRVRVVAEGRNSGRPTVFKFENRTSRDQWLKTLESARDEAIKVKERLEVHF